MLKIRYTGYGGEDYKFGDYPDSCYVRKGDSPVAYFQSMMISADSLIVGHFAIDSAYAGKGVGEMVLRGFANLLDAQIPSVISIQFRLERATSGSDLERLAAARVALLSRVGAKNIEKINTTVKGVWYKSDWKC